MSDAEIRLHSEPCGRCDRLTVPRAEWLSLSAETRKGLRAEGVRRRDARGLCHACWVWCSKNGTLDDHEPQAVANEWLVGEYEHLRPDLPNHPVERLETAARRIGTTTYGLEKALERAGVAS